MIIDMDLQVIYASGDDSLIMKKCQETCWIRIIDLWSAHSTISDFRTDEQLKTFQPTLTLSRFLKIVEMGRKRAIRSNRKNLLRHGLKWYAYQWRSIGYWFNSDHNDFYSPDYSQEFLKKYKAMKLVAVKIV